MPVLSPPRLFLLPSIMLLMTACTTGGAATVEIINTIEPVEQSPDSDEATEEAEGTPEDAEEEMEAEIPACSTELAESFEAGRYADEVVNGDSRSSGLTNLTRSWDTDWTLHTIDYGDVLSGGPPRDGIPSVDSPRFVTIDDASRWLADREPVIVLDIGGDARAYPLQIVTWHEIINDVVCGVPVAVTFCPLCNSALVFDRRVNGEVYEFGVSGLLRNSDLIMYDRSTESLWQQFTGVGIVGQHAGDQLGFIPSSIVSFEEFRRANPQGLALSQNTGHFRNYGINPYAGYDSLNAQPFLFTDAPDPRLPAMRRVVGIVFNEEAAAYPYDALAEEGVIHDAVGEQPLVIFYELGTASALGAARIDNAEDVGAAAVYAPSFEGQDLTFYREDGEFRDNETDSVWNLSGQALSGPLAGSQLTPLVHSDHFWFSWAAFYPDTTIYGLES